MLGTTPRAMETTAEMILRVDVSRRPGYAEVVAAGEIDASVINVFQEAMRTAVAFGEPTVLVDLRRVEYMDSGCIYALLEAWRALDRQPEALRLRLGPAAARVIEASRLSGLMTVVP
jgi:anti-anti-sigma factor